ncbi:flagellar hook-associated protein FlgL [Oceanobacillus luteolus]|uniref:flagellar hook-associated protein FlgL n=1 Tax=Oceanobacillus luteolus TaxID=1274358 RepID=UPI00203F5DAF|nr:flagellar hook-associated protein FlgL [Oceanobacillus luteolus]MCM3740227.1 flagellar hook-associated protein FlgL [Oceanobacillus luteolus]
MRVTQSMLSNNLLRNLNQSYAEMDKYFNQLNTGKKFNRPSDDPVAAMKGIGFRTELHQVEQYQRNTNEVHNWLDNSDSALDQINSGLQRIRYLAVQASNGTYGESELKSIAAEVEQIKADLIETANMKVNDKYIFNGTNTNIPPVNVDAEPIVVEFDDSQVIIKVATNSELAANVDGNKVFMNGEESLFDTIDHFIAKLNGEIDEDMDESIADMDIFIDNVINSRADLGAKMNRLELIENRLAKQEIVATSTLSKNEDINYAETITNLITQESIHRAALSSGARIMQPTLLDFLR